MSIKDLTITDQTVQGIYVQSQPDRLTGTAQQNKAAFDAYPALIKQRFNQLIELLTAESGAGEIPVRPIEGVTAENVQQALAAIQQNLTAYINKLKAMTGAAEVGVSTISGISVGNVQQALEGLRAIQITLDSNIQQLMSQNGAAAVGVNTISGISAGNVQKALEGLRAIQIMLDSNIQQLMSQNGAAAVGVNTISGMQAQNVQKALEELRTAIDNIVSGIIPGGSITADMIVDNAIVQLGALLAVAAAAAYDPEGSYAVGDYCTHDGKLYKCNTPIESGEAWNAAHWTETTVAAELAEKASIIPAAKTQLLFSDNVSGSAWASKNQFGDARIYIHLIIDNGVSFSRPLATVPLGFHPQEIVDFPIAIQNNKDLTQIECALCNISADGEIAYFGKTFDHEVSIIGLVEYTGNI